MADSDFVFTDHMVTVSNQLWMITAVVGACLCFIVLVLIGVVAIHPVSRKSLDRVSFRLLTYALIANMIFGIVNAVGGSFTGPTWACGFDIWILQLTLELSSFLIFSIALNLQLVVVHRVNGKRMEKFYVFGSVFISLAVTIPPYAAKQYGWDPLVQDCWYANDNQQQRLAWQIGTQLFWTLLTVVGEVCTSLTVIVYMIKHRPKGLTLASNTSRTGMRPRSNSTSSMNRQVDLANKYRNVIWRIGLYPFASCLINLTSVVCVIHATVTNGVHNMNEYHILLLSDFLYGGRAVVYALLAATDPSFLRAWQAMLNHERSSLPSITGYSMTGSRSQRTGHDGVIEVELTTTRHRETDYAHKPTDEQLSPQQRGFHSIESIPAKAVNPEIAFELSSDDFVSRMRRKLERERELRKEEQDEFKRQI